MSKIRRRYFLSGLGAGAAGLLTSRTARSAVKAAARPTTQKKRLVYVSPRNDGRFVNTNGFLHAYFKHMRPKLAFDPTMKPGDFDAWREAVRDKLRELLGIPDADKQPPPKRLSTQQREGYRLEKWEAYPEPFSVVPFLVLVPDGVSASSPAPAAMCFPGSSSSKESLAGELEVDGKRSTHRHRLRNRMAREYTQKGIVTVAVDNPGTCELKDSIRSGRYELSIHGMWVGRPYEGISVFQKLCILAWLKRQPYVDAQRIATSGHSLGAKPALILGLLDPAIRAVVWNDGLGNWRRRAVVTNLERIGSFQYVPGMLTWFDYVDLHASMAPRPLLIAEGGRTEYLDYVRQAYELLGAAGQFKATYYPKYADPKQRRYDHVAVPEGLTMKEYYPHANVDAPDHSFRGNVAVPWLTGILQSGL